MESIFDLVGTLFAVVDNLEPTRGTKVLRENRRWLRFIKKVNRDVRKGKISPLVAERMLNPKLNTIGIEEAVEVREFMKYLLSTDLAESINTKYREFQNVREEYKD